MRDVSATGCAPRPEQTRGSPHHTPRRANVEGGNSGELEPEQCSVRDAQRSEFSTRLHPADLHVLDARRGRAAPAPGDELLDLLPGPLDDRLHFASWQVAYLAGQTEPRALLSRARPVEDSLHETRDEQLRASH